MDTCITSTSHWKGFQKILSVSRTKLFTLRDRVRSKKIASLKFGKKILEKDNVSALHMAAENGDLDTLTRLISLGANVNKQTRSKQSQTLPLVYAASNGHLSCVKTLLVAGANVNGLDEWSNTALLKAACYNHTECVKVLLEFGARVNICNKWGAFPLQYAAIQGYNDIVEVLIKYGAKSESCCKNTSLPPAILGAATRCHISSLDILLKSDFETTQLDSSLTVTLYYFLCACAGFECSTINASVQQRVECIKLLVNRGAVIKPEHIKMCCYHHFVPHLNVELYIEILQILLKATTYSQHSSSWNDALSIIFNHITKLGPYKQQLISLICSVGFTPSLTMINSLKHSLTTAEFDWLVGLRLQPRSLTDLSRVVIRERVKTNVVHVFSRPSCLPKPVQDIIIGNNKALSAL